MADRAVYPPSLTCISSEYTNREFFVIMRVLSQIQFERATTHMILDKQIEQELKERYKSLGDSGELLSDEQLAEYYNTFRNKFGPDKLKSLDGEALLETMHSHGTKDSLVY